jgi:hypothetical protein
MANSSIISKSKNKIIKEFIKDTLLLQAIDSPTLDLKQAEKFIGTHIFDYNQNPYTLNNIETFITVQVHIPHIFDYNKTFVRSTVEIWIVSHERHMIVDNVPKVTENRNDYLSELIDKKLNGRNDFGIGTLQLTSNVESSYQADYLFRKMIFETKDLNNSLCNEDN